MADEAELPAPLVPEYVDLRTFDCMPLDVVRLANSEIIIVSSGDEFKAAVLLWARSWHQVPAGSLPDNERHLAYMAGLGTDIRRWRKLSTAALRGWQKCADGRLYHALIADKVAEAWRLKRRGKAGSDGRWGTPNELKNNESGDAQGHAEQDAKRMPRTEQNRFFKKEEGGGSLFSSQASRPKRSARPWTTDEKRTFAWNKISAALGGDEHAWSIIEAAAHGNADAKRVVKAKAKEIGVTWYDGMPVGTAQAERGSSS